MKYALIFTAVASIMQIVIGDIHGYQVTQHQPLKMAMYEGKWETEKGASLDLLGVVDQENQTTHVYIKIPYLLSILSYHDPYAEFKGIKDIIKEYQEKSKEYAAKIPQLEAQLQLATDQEEINKIKDELAMAKAYSKAYNITFADLPPVGLVFTSFHLMVYLGFMFVLLSLVGLYLYKKNRLFDNKAFLWLMVLNIPLPFLASYLGWTSTEVGRQPWIVQGVLMTRDAVTLHPTENVAFTLAVFFVIYTAITITFVISMLKVIRNGITAHVTKHEESITVDPYAKPNLGSTYTASKVSKDV